MFRRETDFVVAAEAQSQSECGVLTSTHFRSRIRIDGDGTIY